MKTEVHYEPNAGIWICHIYLDPEDLDDFVFRHGTSRASAVARAKKEARRILGLREQEQNDHTTGDCRADCPDCASLKQQLVWEIDAALDEAWSIVGADPTPEERSKAGSLMGKLAQLMLASRQRTLQEEGE